MANNFLKYTWLTNSDIVTQIRDKLNADERFQNFTESSIAQTLIEIFAACTDITNYMLERRAEECYFDTARLKSSVVLLARSLGYIVQRPIPAQARLKVRLKGDYSGLDASSTIQIPAHSVFAYNGMKYVLKKTLTINYADYSKVLETDSSTTDYNLTD